MKRLAAVLFDIDGTLVDSVDAHARAWQQAFGEFRLEIPFEAIRKQIGKGGDELLPVFLGEAQIREFGAEVAKRSDAIFNEKYIRTIKPFPQVRALFERLNSDGILIALASSAKSDEIKTYKSIMDVEGLTAQETSADDVEKSKPHGDIFEVALKKLGNPLPDQAIAIGDTAYDAEAAAKAGVKTIGFLCGGWSKQELMKAGCITVYKNPADLLSQYDTSVFTQGI